jgi:ribosomal protein L21E
VISRRCTTNILVTLAVLISLVGCRSIVTPQWSLEDEVTKTTLSPPQLARDAVILEVAFIRVAANINSSDSTFWPGIDETHLSADDRKQLSQNGIRCGLIAGALPDSLNELINGDANTVDLEALTGSLNLNLENRNQRLQFRAGQAGQIVMSKSVKENITVITSDSQYAAAERFNQAQCQFQIKTYPQGDGRVRIELIPQIHHGDPRAEFTGQEGAWLLKTQRAVKQYDAVPIKAMISPGESLLLSADSHNKGLGRQFFVINDDDGKTNHLLLIRLVHTQYDDLFAPNETPLE